MVEHKRPKVDICKEHYKDMYFSCLVNMISERNGKFLPFLLPTVGSNNILIMFCGITSDLSAFSGQTTAEPPSVLSNKFSTGLLQ
jgi:hypothetical protein